MECYTPNGHAWTDHTPCNISARETHCCNPGDYCLDNGHCLQVGLGWPMRIGRGTCTDSTWMSINCPTHCADVGLADEIAIYDAGLEVHDSTSKGTYCCAAMYNLSSQCPNVTRASSAPFSINAGHIIWNRTDGSVMANGTILESQLQQSITNVTTVTVTASSCSRKSDVAPITAGIAVPLGVCLLVSLAVIGVLVMRLRNTKEAMRKQQLGPAVQSRRWFDPFGQATQMQDQPFILSEAPNSKDPVEIDAHEHNLHPHELQDSQGHELRE